MKFTELYQELKAAYPEQPRAFHVIAARYYLGVESLEELKSRCEYPWPALTEKQVNEIIENR